MPVRVHVRLRVCVRVLSVSVCWFVCVGFSVCVVMCVCAFACVCDGLQTHNFVFDFQDD